MRIIVVISMAAATNLAACSSTLEWARMNTYNFQAYTIELEGEKFKVYRHKIDNSLMVSPGSAPRAAPKFVTPLTLDQKLFSTAEQYLKETGLSRCEITKDRALQGQVHEFWFEC